MKQITEYYPKVLVVGIDAADPEYIRSRFDREELPNLATFLSKGAWGSMKSTFPVLSSAAWSTIATGLPPEKHGIYEFFRRTPGTWKDLPIHGGMKRGKDFWAVAAEKEVRSVVINMPITYPPKPVPGCVIISGMDTPGEQTAFVSPTEEKAPLLEAVPEYRIELTAAQFKTMDAFLDAVSRTMDARMQAARFFFDRHRPELAVVIFTALDRVLHALWKWMDPAHPAYQRPEAEKWRKKVDALYDQVDGYLGELIHWAGERSRVIVCSDHGGAAVHGIFHLNRWLMQEGYLELKSAGSATMLHVAGKAQKWVKRNVPSSIKNRINRLFPNLYANVETTQGLTRIDPARTRAYGWRKTDVIRVNLAGREPGGIIHPGEEFRALVAEIQEKLEKLVDTRNGHHPVRKVWTRFDVYPRAGELDDCPDLVIEWNDRLYECSTTLDHPSGPIFEDEELTGNAPWSEEINGNHALYGIFGAMGPGIKPLGDIGQTEILAVAPTVLTALGVPIPSSMPGFPPRDLFGDEIQGITSREPESGGTEDEESSPVDEVYTDEEREMIEKRLRDLGYM